MRVLELLFSEDITLYKLAIFEASGWLRFRQSPILLFSFCHEPKTNKVEMNTILLRINYYDQEDHCLIPQCLK